MNNMGPTAQIISRTGWSTDMDFVGHRKAVSCVVSSSYHPRKIIYINSSSCQLDKIVTCSDCFTSFNG